VVGLALVCIVELVVAGSGIVRRGRANRARLESDLQAIRSEGARIAGLCAATSARVASIGDTVPGAIKEMRSQVGNLRDGAERLADRVSQFAGRIEALSEQVDVVKSQTQPVNALRMEVAGIKQIASETSSQLSNLQQHGEGILDRVNELLHRIETLSEKHDVVNSLMQRIEVVAKDAPQIKMDVAQVKERAGPIESPSPSIELNVAGLQTPANSRESSISEISRAPNGDGKGLGGHDIAPENRGGGPRKPDRANNGEEKQSLNSLLPRPQLIAQRVTGDWQIYIEVEHEGTETLRVIQGEAELNEANGEEPGIFGPLLDLANPVRILPTGSTPIEFALTTKDRPPFVFRMVQNGFARIVRNPSHGLNLAVVPTGWRYNAAVSGPPPAEPEALGIAGYTVHYYSPDRGTALAFEGRPELAASRSEFQFVGHQLVDAEQRMGPLFIGDPPTLQADCNGAQVRTIVLGEEGPGTGKWRDSYDLEGISNGGWPLPKDIRDRAIGWYFARLYDGQGDLVDSLDFRHVAGLHSMDVTSVRGNGAADKVSVIFRHDESVSVYPSDSLPSELIQTPASQRGSTTFLLRRDPGVPEAQFQLRCRGRTIRVSADTDTIWWARVDPSLQEEPRWQLKTIELTPEDFGPTSNIELLIRIPRSISNTAFLGFHRDERRNIGKPKSDRTRVIRLHEYSEAPDLTRLGTHTLYLWLPNDAEVQRAEIAKIKVFKKCPWCEECGAEPEDLAAHLLREHHDRLFERLVLRGGANSSTDRRSGFACSQCGKFYPESRLPDENPITLLGLHSNESHRGRVAFTKRIRSFNDLPGDGEKWIWKCKLGPTHTIIPPLDDSGALSEKKAHLKEHFSELLREPGSP
jgi:hypothetical protein